ncbi:MAG TPA: hypothetical protein PKC49_04995 [Phycisphaerae bacterium]|nr:hypothetical protein [Phycisphaerae bacterium]
MLALIALTAMFLLFVPVARAQVCGTPGDIVCCGDVDGDGIVTSAGYDIVSAEWDAGCTGCCLGDVNLDGVVNQYDPRHKLSEWLKFLTNSSSPSNNASATPSADPTSFETTSKPNPSNTPQGRMCNVQWPG